MDGFFTKNMENNNKPSINRREFLKLAGIFSISALLAGCDISFLSSTPTPISQEIPTINPFDTSPYADLARYYPAVESLQINEEPIKLGTAIPTEIYNFTHNRTINFDAAKNVFNYFESLAMLNKTINYSFQTFDQSSLILEKRPVNERSIILIPSGGAILTKSPLSKSDEITATTFIDDSQPTKIKTYTFIKVDDITNGDQSVDPSNFRKFVTEACQSTISVKLDSDISPNLTLAYQNIGQEIVCNSLSIEIEDRRKGVPYKTHFENLKNKGIGGLFPIIISSQTDYLSMPQLEEIIK